MNSSWYAPYVDMSQPCCIASIATSKLPKGRFTYMPVRYETVRFLYRRVGRLVNRVRISRLNLCQNESSFLKSHHKVKYESSSIAKWVCQTTDKDAREKWRKCISVTGSLRGQAQVRPIDKLDETCTNTDDRMILVQHCSGDRVMS